MSFWPLRKEVEHVFDGSGFLVPRKEGRNITACTWTSTKWLHTSPDDKVLLRCYVGRSGDEQNVELPDEALTELVMKDLRETMGIQATPIFSRLQDCVNQCHSTLSAIFSISPTFVKSLEIKFRVFTLQEPVMRAWVCQIVSDRRKKCPYRLPHS